MKFFNDSGEVVRFKLEKKALSRVRAGYPWIYQDWLKEHPPTTPGRKAIVRDSDGDVVAVGYCDGSTLAIRVLARATEQLGDELVASRLIAAWRRRESLRQAGVTGYRLVHGEGDGLAGFVCDLYDSVLVIKLDGEAAENFWNAKGIAQWCVEQGFCTSVVQRFRGSSEYQVLESAEGSDLRAVPFVEYGCRFTANVLEGQKTGFFFDQRENRRLIGSVAHARRVLNLFSYSGGFSVHAGRAGATAVTSVDLAAPALVDAGKNWILNNLNPAHHQGISADAFEFLESALSSHETWDLIVVDPPAFARSKKHLEQATKAYERIFALAAKCLAPQGMLALSSCSRHISAEDFLQTCEKACRIAKRSMVVLANNGQALDHPVPLQCPELRYLKFVLLGAA
jgi:23S rRNA (cytosine1962-C5)-methyltransferase